MVWDILRRSPATFALPAARPEASSILRGALGVTCITCILLALAGCDLLLEQKYYKEGIGTDLTVQNAPSPADLQDIYLNELCRQAGLVEMAGSEPVRGCPNPYGAGASASWGLVALAGMNDIDQRCDAYLAWLDDKRRSQAPILAEINAVQNAAQAILRTTGVGANPITLVGLAFGLGADTFTNVRSRLLLEANHSTVQSVVLSRQKDYRDGLKVSAIDSRVAAIYALRSYLRICMPMTIEMQINTTVAIFEQGGSAALRVKEDRPLIDPKMTGRLAISAQQTIAAPPRSPVSSHPEYAEVFDNPSQITPGYLKEIQTALCVPDKERGSIGADTKALISIFEASYRRARKNGKLDSDEIGEILGQGRCVPGWGRNYFEKRTYPNAQEGIQPLEDLVMSLNKAQPSASLTVDNVKTLDDARAKIKAVRQLMALQLKLMLPPDLSDQITPDLLSVLAKL